MRKSMRTIAITMVMSMALSVVPQCMPKEFGITKVEAAEKKTSKVTYKLKKGVLTISGKGQMPKSMTFAKNKKIKKVVIKKGVTSIPKNAFTGCKKLKSVKIANTVKSIGENAFKNTALESVVIPKSVKSIGNYAFWTKKLKEVEMPGDFDVVGYWHNEYYNMESVIGPKVKQVNLNTNFILERLNYIEAVNINVLKSDPEYKSIDGVIYSKDGKKLKGVPAKKKEVVTADKCEIVDFDAITYGRASDGEPYNPCIIKTLTLSSDVRYVTYKNSYMNYTLKSIYINTDKLTEELKTDFCNYLYTYTEADVIFDENTDIDTTQEFVQSNGELTGYYGSDKKVIVPEGITVIGDYAFARNKNIEEVILPETVQRIEEGAFYECENLVTVELTESVTNIGEKAFALTSLEKIEFPEGITRIGEEAFAGTNITEIKYPKNLKYAEAAFLYTKIKSVELPDDMEVIPEDLFSCCYQLESVKLPSKLKVIGGGAFYECIRLKSVTGGDNVEKIEEYAFKKCKNMEYSIPKCVTYIGTEAFYGCKKIKEVVLDKVTYIGSGAFNNCRGMKKIVLQGKFEKIPAYMCNHCTRLKTIKLPNTIKEIGQSAFEYCKRLVSFKGCSKVKKIRQFAFNGCEKLKMKIPNSVTYFGRYCFCVCSKLNVKIPKKTTYIGEEAFFYTNWKKIVLPKTVKFVGESAFGVNVKGTGKIIVKCKSNVIKDDIDGLNNKTIKYQ